MDQTTAFEAERPRLVRLAARILSDTAEAEDMVQQAWLRLVGVGNDIESLPAWLTTVTTRLCLDRLRARVPMPTSDDLDIPAAEDPAHDVELAETVGVALQVVLDRLSPRERVAFVLHDSFGFEFDAIAGVLETTPTSARKLASRARAKIGQPSPDDRLADWEIVDAFMAAAREGEFARLMQLLAPDATIDADSAAVSAGTPARMDGREPIATFFNGAAKSALPVFVESRPGSAWFHQGEARVAFDFRIVDGLVAGITFRAEPGLLAHLVRRTGGEPHRKDHR